MRWTCGSLEALGVADALDLDAEPETLIDVDDLVAEIDLVRDDDDDDAGTDVEDWAEVVDKSWQAAIAAASLTTLARTIFTLRRKVFQYSDRSGSLPQ